MKESFLFLSDFDFELPEEFIAQTPAQKRDHSRLMRLTRNQNTPPVHSIFHELPSLLQEGDLLVFNDTRVIPARIFAQKETGGKVELLFVEEKKQPIGVIPIQQEKTKLQQKEKNQEVLWTVLARASRPLQEGSMLTLVGGETIQVKERIKGGEYLVKLSPSLVEKGFLSYLEKQGELPLPPYISPAPKTTNHQKRYQTIYAKTPGAIAAPTAGLHFTESVFDELRERKISLAWITLHVGLGTFLPVRTEKITEHAMHTEVYNIPTETVDLWKETRTKGHRVIAVGTTALRALESSCAEDGILKAGSNATSIFIYPGYTFRGIDGLLTNFHLPRSTLLMLVSALHGRERILSAYQEAIAKNYRFFSYGDAMLIL